MIAFPTASQLPASGPSQRWLCMASSVSDLNAPGKSGKVKPHRWHPMTVFKSAASWSGQSGMSWSVQHPGHSMGTAPPGDSMAGSGALGPPLLMLPSSWFKMFS